ncbi:hypothetical protein [Sandaracinus amylolyticus]|uniref:SWIM-type domain-containing protein n=1 Tax=Sandaracinus amylolyticus TaxID=927083 RepID=A0A0F6SFD4_9BACT|nr:hypothetical protein [Sandaracinus amylolyticus]AKF06749.1 hypothetical protein DB32_003898 [Sandaracinus amylolyticus]
MTATSFAYKYAGRSGAVASGDRARLALATSTLREATYFAGELDDVLPLREGLAALYDVAVSDFRYHPRDRTAFRAWLAEQDRLFLAGLAAKSTHAKARLGEIQLRIGELDRARAERRASFEKARRAYVQWAIEDELERSLVLDPVVTVHPDELSFEAFSRDQSSYARLAVGHAAFSRIDAIEHGTTNVDFSSRLHDHFDRMRSYRATRFEIAPGGFEAETIAALPETARSVHEKKITMPEGWLAGFLQVHGLMSMGLERVELAPVDVYNVIRVIRARRAQASPRSLRWQLTPGERTKILIEPFDVLVTGSPISRFHGAKERSIRTWGRDRLRVLERVLPLAERVQVFLAGSGLPSIWVCDLGGRVTFTLALSGWTDNDWAGGQAKFDLLTRRLPTNADELTRVYGALRDARRATDAEIAARCDLGVEKARSALSILAQAGRAMYDVVSGLHRHRDLLLVPFSASAAIAEAKVAEIESSPKAKTAKEMIDHGGVRIIARRPTSMGYKLSGSARGESGPPVRPLLAVDHEGQILEASCTCVFAEKHGLTKGPCEHVLALRLAHMAKLEEEDQAKKKGSSS